MNAVSLLRHDHYDPEAVLDAVRRLLAPLGGMEAFVAKGERVLVKPNLVLGRKPDSAVCTHPTVVRAVVLLAREAGAGVVAVGDSPGHGDAARAAEAAGFAAVCRELDAPWVEFTPTTVARPGRPFPTLELAKEVVWADAVVNAAKLKTHGQMLMSLSMKNCFGAVPGYRKLQWHYRAGHDAARFARMLYEIYKAVNPRLNLVDGIVGMDGLGPTAGRPNPTRLLAAGGDGASVDAALLDVLGLPRQDLPLLEAAREAGDRAFERMTIVGGKAEDFRPEKFEIPRVRRPVMHGEWVDRWAPWLGRWLRQQLSSAPFPGEKCVKCGQCVALCPAGVIRWEPGTRPEIDLKRCLRCYCCHELCPYHAMELRPPGWLGRKLFG